MICPLCSNKNVLNIRKFSKSKLAKSWQKSFGFDPFSGRFDSEYLVKKKCISCDFSFYDPPFYGDADFYAELSHNAWYYEVDKWEYDVAIESIIRFNPESILVVGCGAGFFLEKLRSSEIAVEGLDINEAALSLCREKGLSVSSDDIFSINKSYDMVVLFEVLEHMDTPNRLMRHLKEVVVKPGGYLIIAVPNPSGYFAEVSNNLLDMPPHHNSAWSRRCFEGLQTLFNFQLIDYQKEPLRLIHYQGLMQHLLIGVNELSVRSWKFNLFSKVQSLVIRLLAPLTYLRDRDNVDGQTHLAIFKNIKE